MCVIYIIEAAGIYVLVSSIFTLGFLYFFSLFFFLIWHTSLAKIHDIWRTHTLNMWTHYQNKRALTIHFSGVVYVHVENEVRIRPRALWCLYVFGNFAKSKKEKRIKNSKKGTLCTLYRATFYLIRPKNTRMMADSNLYVLFYFDVCVCVNYGNS